MSCKRPAQKKELWQQPSELRYLTIVMLRIPVQGREVTVMRKVGEKFEGFEIPGRSA